MILKRTQFLQRFCLHILPNQFRKIRHFGFLSNATKNKALNLAKQALLQKKHTALNRIERKALAIQRVLGYSFNQCPCCKNGQMVVVEILAPNKDPPNILKTFSTGTR